MMSEYFARCYQTTIEAWSAGVVHPKPAIELYLIEHGVTILIADEYEHLEAMLRRLLEKVGERKAADSDKQGTGQADRGRRREVTSYQREVLADVLVYHWRDDIKGCGCGWAVLGGSWPEHVADVYEESVAAGVQP